VTLPFSFLFFFFFLLVVGSFSLRSRLATELSSNFASVGGDCSSYLQLSETEFAMQKHLFPGSL